MLIVLNDDVEDFFWSTRVARAFCNLTRKKVVLGAVSRCFHHLCVVQVIYTEFAMASSAAGPSQHAYRASSPQTENVLILGLRRSGKSSIINVVYKSLSPDDSLFLESTLKCQYFDVNTFQKVRIWDGTGGDLEASSLATSQQHQNLSKDRLKQTSIDNDPRGKLAWGSSGQLYWTECAALVFVIDSQVRIELWHELSFTTHDSVSG